MQMKIMILVLTLFLLITNSLWFAHTILDQALWNEDIAQNLRQTDSMRKQLMLILPDVAKGKTKKDIIDIALKYSESNVFEKDGCTWIGSIGFNFDEKDQLVAVSQNWSFGSLDPCHVN